MVDALILPRIEPIFRPKLLIPTSPWMVTKFGLEVMRDEFNREEMSWWDKYLRAGIRDRIRMMAGSDGNWLSAQIAGKVDGATAMTSVATWYPALYTAAVDDTMTGATANEAAYTSYARMSLTNNTTNFAAGSGSTTSTNSWPSDAAHNFATSTGGSATITYMAKLSGNAGTTADKCGCWASVTSTAIANGDTPQLAQNAVSQTRD